MSTDLLMDTSDLTVEDREEYDKVEKWLDDHPEFVNDYFARKARRSMVDGWLISHAITHSGLQVPSETGSSGSSSKPSSGANTPVRKISAQELDKGCILKPLVSTVDGTPTFLGLSNSSGSTSNVKTHRKSRSELKALDEKELMYELVIGICNDLDVTSLCYKILQNVCMLLNADRCSLFLVQGKGTGDKCLVSKLFDVSIESTLEYCSERTDTIKIPWGMGIIGWVAKTGDALNIPDAYEDHRFNHAVDIRTGYKTRSILCMPIKDSDGLVVGVAQAINKISVRDEPFDEHDEKVFSSYLAFCGIGLRNAQLYERSLLENTRSNVLLDLARVIFEEQNNVANLIHKIMVHSQSLLQCERCQVLLVDEGSKVKNSQKSPPMGIFSQVFDLQASDFDNDDSYNREGPNEPRFPINIGITGYVAATGEQLNIPDAYQDEKFDRSVDDNTKFRTRSILCMPIRNAQGQVIGVSQLINKQDGTTFNKNDENLFEAFAIFCGMGIHNTQIYETAITAMAKQRVALEVLSYHASAPQEEADRIKTMAIPSTHHYNLLDYKFSDFALDDDDTIKASIRMFTDLNMMERFSINYEVLCRWLLSVKKNYREVTYHNWRHAFNVAQTMYCMLMGKHNAMEDVIERLLVFLCSKLSTSPVVKTPDRILTGQMINVLSDVERLALLVGCLCHDLDHRGTNNQFQIKSMSALAELYSTSTLEHHHFDQCIMITSTKGNDILANLQQQEYEKTIQLLENAILATDLALYFRYRGEFFELVSEEKADWTSEDHRELLRAMMMTACDVSAITKPWEVQKKVATLVAREFFEQGDIEKEELKLKPQDMMDRDKEDQLPSMQVSFIDFVCMPVYQAISKVSTRLEPLLNGCRENRDHWQTLADLQNKKLVDEEKSEVEDKDSDSESRPREKSPPS